MRTRGMRMQVVLDQTNTLDLGVVRGQQMLHTCRIIHRRASSAHFHRAPPGMRLTGEQDPAGPVFLVFIMVAFRLARAHR
jgi:hypothetical protein